MGNLLNWLTGRKTLTELEIKSNEIINKVIDEVPLDDWGDVVVIAGARSYNATWNGNKVSLFLTVSVMTVRFGMSINQESFYETGQRRISRAMDQIETHKTLSAAEKYLSH